MNSLDMSYAIIKGLRKLFPDVSGGQDRKDGPGNETRVTVTVRGQSFEITVRSAD